MEESAARCYAIERLGIPCCLQFREMSWGYVIQLLPEQGFVHLCPPDQVQWAHDNGKVYHMTIANRELLPRAALEICNSRFNNIRRRFSGPVKCVLKVWWCDHDSFVARICPHDQTMAASLSDLLYLRSNFGRHGNDDLTVSL